VQRGGRGPAECTPGEGTPPREGRAELGLLRPLPLGKTAPCEGMRGRGRRCQGRRGKGEGAPAQTGKGRNVETLGTTMKVSHRGRRP
jgi:hypothetical protein